MHKTIYLDANIFLHYQPFDQINWPEVVKAESVTLVFPPITIRELNKHKDSHPRAQVKKRAGEAIKRLSGLLDSNSSAKLREKVDVFFESRDPSIDFAAHQLNFNIQDDQLIASIVMNKQESPADHIVLITSDLGLTLLAKADRLSIDRLKLPENLRLPEELDPQENRVKQLEQQIRELNSRAPSLLLAFESNENFAKFKLDKPIVLNKTYLDNEIEVLRKKFPKREKEVDKTSTDVEKMSAILAMQSLGVSSEEINRYNNELEDFFSSYASFIRNNTELENQKRRTIKLEVALVNEGTLPAEDIDIFLHFPDGFQLLEEDDLPDFPEPPDPPIKPMTQMEKLAYSMNHLNGSLSVPYMDSLNHLPSGSPSNVSGPNIKRVNSYDVHMHVQRVKHNLREFFEPLFIIFDSLDTSNSFEIEYQILAANIPQEISGSLHVIIEKD